MEQQNLTIIGYFIFLIFFIIFEHFLGHKLPDAFEGDGVVGFFRFAVLVFLRVFIVSIPTVIVMGWIRVMIF